MVWVLHRRNLEFWPSRPTNTFTQQGGHLSLADSFLPCPGLWLFIFSGEPETTPTWSEGMVLQEKVATHHRSMFILPGESSTPVFLVSQSHVYLDNLYYAISVSWQSLTPTRNPVRQLHGCLTPCLRCDNGWIVCLVCTRLILQLIIWAVYITIFFSFMLHLGAVDSHFSIELVAWASDFAPSSSFSYIITLRACHCPGVEPICISSSSAGMTRWSCAAEPQAQSPVSILDGLLININLLVFLSLSFPPNPFLPCTGVYLHTTLCSVQL